VVTQWGFSRSAGPGAGHTNRCFQLSRTACPSSTTTGQHASEPGMARGLEPLAKLNLGQGPGPRPDFSSSADDAECWLGGVHWFGQNEGISGCGRPLEEGRKRLLLTPEIRPDAPRLIDRCLGPLRRPPRVSASQASQAMLSDQGLGRRCQGTVAARPARCLVWSATPFRHLSSDPWPPLVL